MKRLFAMLLALIMVFSLAACGGKNPSTESQAPEVSATPEVQEPSFGIDLTVFYNDMMNAAGEVPMMMDMSADAELLEVTYPGLPAIETKQLVAVAPMMSAVALEFVFVEVANAADVEAVKTILQTRIDNQVAGGAWYPETIEQWEKYSEIVVIDNYVCLFVTSDKDGLIDAFRNGTEIPSWAEAPEVYVDLMSFYNDLCDEFGENFPANADMTEFPEMLDSFFPGLSEIETKQLVAYQPMMGAVVCEIVLVEVANSEDVAAVEAILQARIDAQVDGGAWYPESIEGWQNNSRIVSFGNYTMMIAYSECDTIVEYFSWNF